VFEREGMECIYKRLDHLGVVLVSSLITLWCLREALYISTQHALKPMQIFTVWIKYFTS
jgi:hypothetical protein